METRVKVFGFFDILLGITMIMTEYSAIVMYSLPMDTTGSGLWGGMFVMVTGVVIIKRHNIMVLVFSILSAMSGIIMICLYIWSFTLYGDMISSGYTCGATLYMGHSICSRIALDSLFLIYGVAALCMNTILIHDAKWIEPHKKQNEAPALTNIPVVVTITPAATNGHNLS
ncbi:uncharacterized protein LOC124210015 [Daphnia pulex]|uniref:uncharacterized protein LOC124210015 n=1 Tax=Daphnia pulex TaxID=6669 RepID=UPI001EDCC07B|nr:uncharacterized protein LOC124210015 [Daphnia pulex]XP_046655570.1 uncharacterized protein LOC124349102 [Daphnia pulicaria]